MGMMDMVCIKILVLGVLCHWTVVSCQPEPTHDTVDVTDEDLLLPRDVVDGDDVTPEITAAQVERPGFKGRITQKGFDFAAATGTDILMKQLSTLSIPTVTADVSMAEVTVSSIKVVSFARPSSKLYPIPWPGYGLRWDVFDLNPVITADYVAEVDIAWWTLTKRGSATFTGEEMQLSLDFFVGKDSFGRPTTEVLSCECHGDVSLEFEGQWSDILNVGSSLFEKKVRGIVTAQICAQAKTEINNELATQLNIIPLTHTVAEHYFLDFSMLHFPIISEDSVDVELKGTVYLADDIREPPFLAPELPVFTEHDDRMIYLYVTDYLINSGFYAAFIQGILAYDITSDMVPDEYQGSLNTSCTSGGLCLGTIFPQISEMYPDQSVSVSLYATSSPQMTIDGKDFTMTADGEADVFVTGENGTMESLFVIGVNIFGSFSLDIVGKKIFLGVYDIEPSASVKESSIGDIGTGFFFESILRVVTHEILIPRLTEFGENGLNIPKLRGVEFLQPMVVESDVKGVFIVGTDIGYEAKKKRRLNRKRKTKRPKKRQRKDKVERTA